MFFEIAICAAAAIAANFLTPSIRTVWERVLVDAALQIRPSCRISAQVRLEQLQEEREEIERLRKHPLEFTRHTAKAAALQIISLWVMVIAISYGWFSLAVENLMQPTWSILVFALIGYTSRFPIGALISLGKVRKASDIDGFRRRNADAQAKLLVMLGRQ